MAGKRLYRAEDDKVVAGVAAGLAHYFEVDPVLVRLIFVALALANGLGVLAYLILWLVVPSEAQLEMTGEEAMRANINDMRARARGLGARLRDTSQSTVLVGIMLVLVGAIFLLETLIPGLHAGNLWPLALIVVGAYLLLRRA